MAPVVAEDGGGCPNEGYAKRDFGGCMGAEVTVIQKVWWEVRLTGSGWWRVMEVVEAAT